MAGKPGALLGKLAKGAAPSAGGKKKDEKTIITIDDKADIVDGFLRAHADEKDASGRKEQFKALLAEGVEPLHKAANRAGRGFQGAIILDAKGKRLLCYVQYNKLHQNLVQGSGDETMAKIAEVLAKAEALFGKEEAERFLTTQYAIAFRKEGMSDDVLAKVMEAVGGQDEFNKIFEIKAQLTATEELHERRFTDEAIDAKAKQLEAFGLKRYSPALKPE